MTTEVEAVDTAAQQDLTGSASVLGDAVQPGDLADGVSSAGDGGVGAPGGSPAAGNALGAAATDPDQPVTQGP